jgi:hypothetical protein
VDVNEIQVLTSRNEINVRRRTAGRQEQLLRGIAAQNKTRREEILMARKSLACRTVDAGQRRAPATFGTKRSAPARPRFTWASWKAQPCDLALHAGSRREKQGIYAINCQIPSPRNRTSSERRKAKKEPFAL